MQEELFIKFAEFEEKVGEMERARAIYKYALDHIPRAQADNVYRRFVSFEKQHGDREGIEVIHAPCFHSNRAAPTMQAATLNHSCAYLKGWHSPFHEEKKSHQSATSWPISCCHYTSSFLLLCTKEECECCTLPSIACEVCGQSRGRLTSMDTSHLLFWAAGSRYI